MKDVFKGINIEYKPNQKELWVGRTSNPLLENQYWYQCIKSLNLKELTKNNQFDIAILGYACDEGVRRNLGRVGARKGPEVIRKSLAKFPLHFQDKTIVDLGDIVCVEEDLESCQKALSNTINHLISNQIFPIVLGGGHDVAYGHFSGIRKALENTSNHKIGIINFDAHFDLRYVEDRANSGTPFNQILQESKNKGEPVDYFVIGIQKQSNTRELFDIAKNNNVDFVFNTDCTNATDKIEMLKDSLKPFVEKNDYIYITIDMDGFSSAYASGVSAPSPLGYSPLFVFEILKFLMATKKVISCDIAELNPNFDNDSQTANLAAKLIDFIVCEIKN